MRTRYISNRQYGKALPYCLRLRRPNVFTLIGEHSLFADVRDQVLLLVEFEQEFRKERKEDREKSQAIDLLVEHTHSIPVRLLNLLRVKQLIIAIITRFHVL